jgi:hypothetical protein
MDTGFSGRNLPGKGRIRRPNETISLGARTDVVSASLEFLNMFPDSHAGDAQVSAEDLTGDEFIVLINKF